MRRLAMRRIILAFSLALTACGPDYLPAERAPIPPDAGALIFSVDCKTKPYPDREWCEFPRCAPRLGSDFKLCALCVYLEPDSPDCR